MKVTFTFEYSDLLTTIEKELSMNGVEPIRDAEGTPDITFNHKKKEVTVRCVAAPVPTACPFCKNEVHTKVPKQKYDDAKPTANSDELQTTISTANDDALAIDGEQSGDEDQPMTLAQLKAASTQLSRKPGPIKVQRGAEAHAALVTSSRLEGEMSEPPFGGGG